MSTNSGNQPKRNQEFPSPITNISPFRKNNNTNQVFYLSDYNQNRKELPSDHGTVRDHPSNTGLGEVSPHPKTQYPANL
jgi:hypothetical protein